VRRDRRAIRYIVMQLDLERRHAPGVSNGVETAHQPGRCGGPREHPVSFSEVAPAGEPLPLKRDPSSMVEGAVNRIRYILVALLTAAILLFAVQNLRGVDVAFLMWQFRVSVSLIALTPFLAGLLVGAATALYYAARRSQPPPLAAAGSAAPRGSAPEPPNGP
jgi:uncharacterized integral membrane protein